MRTARQRTRGWNPALAALVALIGAKADAQAPAGFKTFENKLAGLKFCYPIAYKQIPVAPTEQVIQARYLRRTPPKELARMAKRSRSYAPPGIIVFLFENISPVTPRGGDAAKKKKKPTGKGPRTTREAMEAQNSVHSFAEFKKKRLKNWELTEVPKKEGHFSMFLKGRSAVGYMIVKQDGSRTYGVYGYTLTPHLKKLTSRLIKMGWSLSLADTTKTTTAEAKLDQLYAGEEYRGLAKRKAVRRDLAKGWKALDTTNYIIVYHTRNMRLVNKIARDIEAMRLVYEKLFPPVGTVDAVSIVRVCRSLGEYRQYGGPPGTGGYWHHGNEELVFFDYLQTMRDMTREEKRRRKSKRRLTDKDSMLVLYHEAFHQYIHYAVGAFSPHDWFNEGFGDYFSGAIIPSNMKTVARIGPSPWRIHRAKNQCEHDEGFVPLRKLLRAPRPEFYGSRRADYYAAAWSFVYFLKNDKKAVAHPLWSKLLDSYFQTIKVAYARELKGLGKAPPLAAKQMASGKARKVAIDKTLEGVDLDELQAAWRKYVVKTRDPWRSQRPKRKK